MRMEQMPPDLAAKVRAELKQIDGEAFECACGQAIVFAVIAVLQFGLEHPDCDARLRTFAVEFGRHMQSWLGGPDRPNVDKLIEEGWRTGGGEGMKH